MGQIVYLLCFLTSFACSVFLFRGFRSTKYKLLFWSGLGFVGFALNNLVLMIDMMIVPQIDLSLLRTLLSVVGMTLLVYGLISEETKA